MPKPKRRSKKGSVQIVNRNGLLTLRLSYEGARHQRALGLPDTPINRELARRKACEVELDIASGNFDPTFDQYFPREAAPIARPTTLELWEQFIEHRRNAHTSEQAVASRSNKRSLVGIAPLLQTCDDSRRISKPNSRLWNSSPYCDRDNPHVLPTKI